jgi:hypothetical protein
MTEEEMDELLNRALVSYAREPRPGLEQRVLHRLDAAGRRRTWLIPVWTFGLMLVVCAVLVFMRKPSAPVAIRNARPSTPPPLATRQVVVRTPKSLPKQSTFPAPLPLTDGERALLALAVQYPAAAEVAIDLGKKSSEPIQIEPLDIQPLIAQNGQ